MDAETLNVNESNGNVCFPVSNGEKKTKKNLFDKAVYLFIYFAGSPASMKITGQIPSEMCNLLGNGDMAGDDFTSASIARRSSVEIMFA